LTGFLQLWTNATKSLDNGAMKLTPDEITAGKLNESNFELATQTLHDEGIVILEEALDERWVQKMRAAVSEQLNAKYEYAEEELARTSRHGGIQSPIRMPFMNPLIIENPLVFQILKQVLGERFFGCLPYGCNTTFPGSEAQNVHRDCGHIFPEIQDPMPPLMIVVNISLDQFTAENGATEVWPGSHLLVDGNSDETSTLRIPPERCADLKSEQTLMPAGSIVLRDMRTWHRGMPNTTDESRTMLSIVYYRQYFLPDNFTLPLSEKEFSQFSDKAKLVFRLRREKTQTS
jgi:ectoine hydroxylase-related dioxygenase (phytanoyl-CoA dioxygenase family)